MTLDISEMNVFNWATDSITHAPGQFGYTLYDENKKILARRQPAHAFSNDDKSVAVSSTIHSITFRTDYSDGFYGWVDVTIPRHGKKQTFTCIDCYPGPSRALGRLYLDTNMDGPLDVAGAANCKDSCTFEKGTNNLH